MPGLLIKDLPPRLHRLLKARAKEHRRSMAGEALTLLEDALVDRELTNEELDVLRVVPSGPITAELLDEAKRTGRR